MKRIILIICILVLSGCTRSGTDLKTEYGYDDWTLIGAGNFCRAVEIESVKCIVCEAGAHGGGVDCDFNN